MSSERHATEDCRLSRKEKGTEEFARYMTNRREERRARRRLLLDTLHEYDQTGDETLLEKCRTICPEKRYERPEGENSQSSTGMTMVQVTGKDGEIQFFDTKRDACEKLEGITYDSVKRCIKTGKPDRYGRLYRQIMM
ncbi:MAG: hypothetical protein LBM95_03415 [Lactobacillales bacterium]|jgi:hypothetical protein|nr:hypothetical protein [Lactobacillales bacterium]